MSIEQLRKAYRTFFRESEEGMHFVETLEALINQQHTKAENAPESARDATQVAKGVRQVLEHINITLTEAKKK